MFRMQFKNIKTIKRLRSDSATPENQTGNYKQINLITNVDSRSAC